MKLTFVTCDVGNGSMLRVVANLATKQGHDVTTYFGTQGTFPAGTDAAVRTAVAGADRLIVSISSSEERAAMERIAMTAATERGVPFAIMSDTYGMWHRMDWFMDIAAHAALLTVVTASELDQARAHVGSGTVVQVVPNPSWSTYFAPPSDPHIRERLGVGAHQKVLLVVGTKEHDRNHALLADLSEVSLPDDVSLVITSHPVADHTLGELGYLTDTARARFVDPREYTDSFSILCASDLVVACGGSSMTIMAACRRIPAIDLMHPADLAYWKSLSGLDVWPPIAEGTSALARNASELGRLIPMLLEPASQGSRRMRGHQEDVYRQERFAGAAQSVLDAVSRL